jgi:hypothetical protein
LVTTVLAGDNAVWFGSFLDGRLPGGSALVGNTFLDGSWGITADGEGDYATIVSQPYATTGVFTVSFWFTTKGGCTGSGSEYLYSHQSAANISPESPTNPGIHVILVCEEAPLLKVLLVDDDGNRGVFDTPLLLDKHRAGGTLNEWMHVVLVVSTTSAGVYLDGAPAEALLEQGTCYQSVGVPSLDPDCKCHPTCASCGYASDESGYTPDDHPGDCITCADGGPVNKLYDNGTGDCPTRNLDGSNWVVTACAAGAPQVDCNNALDPTALAIPFTSFVLAGRDIVLAGQNDQVRP